MATAETSNEPRQPSRLEKKNITRAMPEAHGPQSPKQESAARPTWIVDAMNVIGARPDGWWRDRPAAVVRLVESVGSLSARTGARATVVLDGDAPRGTIDPPGVRVLGAARRGRDAADDTIVALLAASGAPQEIRVATSDARLAARARALGASVEGAGAFRARLEATG